MIYLTEVIKNIYSRHKEAYSIKTPIEANSLAGLRYFLIYKKSRKLNCPNLQRYIQEADALAEEIKKIKYPNGCIGGHINE